MEESIEWSDSGVWISNPLFTRGRILSKQCLPLISGKHIILSFGLPYLSVCLYFHLE